jgi:4,5-dihydroxyphthalate decarboxylase
MTKLPLTIAAVPYDRVRPIIDGKVEVEGCEVNFFPLEPEEAFHRAFHSQDFDVTELSSSSHILTTARGDAPYIAVPVPILRIFRHGAVYVRADRGIERPEDLRGKTVGVPEYQMTAALWVRGFLADEYGVRAQDIRWRNGGLFEPGRMERTDIALPDDIELKPIPRHETLSGQFEAGALDALVSPRPPSGFGQGNNAIRYLFRDVRGAEEAYYKKTGLFPIMHLIAIRRSLVEKHPWLAVSVFKAFCQARDVARAELRQVAALHPMALPWIVDDLRRVSAVMGPDFGGYGLAQNRKEIDAMLRWSVEQGLSRQTPSLEDLIARSTFETSLV